MRTIACPLCHEPTFREIWKKQYAHLLVVTVLCSTCGLVYHNPVVEDSDRQALGLSHQELHTAATFSSRHLRRAERRLRHQRPFLESLVRPGWRTLEIGCGLGYLSAWLKRQGCLPLGVEPDPQQAEFARTRFGLEIWINRFEELRFHQQFDFFASSHVIEHFPEPLLFLQRLREIAAPDAYLFLETPNILAPKVSPWRIFSLAHNFYFSPTTLAASLTQTGWRVLKTRVFQRDSFLILAQAAKPQPCLPPRHHAQEVWQAIRRHRRQYYLQLQFIWRKIPLWQRLWMYRYRDFTGLPDLLNPSVSMG